MKRISWIDIARGLGIIFVIYGHAINAHSIRYIFYSFHMPLFFFLSGMVFRMRENERLLQFIVKSAKNLLLPYLILAYLTWFLWYATLNHHPYPFDQYVTQLLHLLIGNGKDRYFVFNNILWFLPCLFVTRVLFALLYKIFRASIKSISLALFFFSILGYTLASHFPRLALPLGTEVALSAVVFYGLGFLFQKYESSITPKVMKKKAVLFLLSFVLLITFAYMTFSLYHTQIDMRLSRLHNYPLFYITSLLGISCTCILSMWVDRQKVLEYLGKNSLVLFAWHMVFFAYFTLLMRHTSLPPFLKTHGNYLLAPIYSILAMITILTLSYLYTKGKTALLQSIPRTKSA